MGKAVIQYDSCGDDDGCNLQVSFFIAAMSFAYVRCQTVNSNRFSKSILELTDAYDCSEWVGKAIAALLLGIVATMIWARRRRIPDKVDRIVIYTGSDQTTMESIVSAQLGLRSVYDLIKTMNVTILKIWSVLVSKAPKVRYFALHFFAFNSFRRSLS